MSISERVKEIRKKNKLSQAQFGERLRVSRDVINNIENNRINISELIIKTICMEFNLNEEWLRTGEGLQEIQSDTFSLDEYIKNKNGTELEIEIVKAYFELKPSTRQEILNLFKQKLNIIDEIVVTNDNISPLQKSTESLVAEAEGKYIKNVLKSAPKEESIALNFTEEIKKSM